MPRAFSGNGRRSEVYCGRIVQYRLNGSSNTPKNKAANLLFLHFFYRSHLRLHSSLFFVSVLKCFPLFRANGYYQGSIDVALYD